MFSYDISDELKEIIRKLNKWNKLYKESIMSEEKLKAKVEGWKNFLGSLYS